MSVRKTEQFYQTIDWGRVIRILDPRIKRYLVKSKKFLMKNIKGNVLVLEAGCGDGSFIDEISRQVEKVVGIDYSEELLGKARKKLRGRKNVKLIAGNVELVRLPKNYFDYAISLWTLPNLDHPEGFIKKLREAVKENGVIFIDTYSEKATQARIKSYAAYGLTVLGTTRDEILVKEGLTEKIHTKSKLKKLFVKLGLKAEILELTPFSYMCKATKLPD